MTQPIFKCGHPRTPANSSRAGKTTSGKPTYRCLTCKNTTEAARYHANKATEHTPQPVSANHNSNKGRKLGPNSRSKTTNYPCGHPRTAENTTSTTPGTARCKTCYRQTQMELYYSRKAALGDRPSIPPPTSD